MLIESVKSRKAKALAGALRCPPVGARNTPMSRAGYWYGSVHGVNFEVAAGRLPVRRHRPQRVLLAVTAGVRAPLLSLTGRALLATAVSKLRARFQKRERSGLRNKQQQAEKPDTAKPSPGGRPLAEGPRCGIGFVRP